MIVVGLDPSLTSAGIAILRDGQPVLCTAIGHTGRDGESYDDRSRRIVSQCRAVMQTIEHGMHGTTTMTGRPGALRDLNLAVMEGPSYGDNMPSTFDRSALWHGLYSALRAKHIPVAVIPPATLKLWATGNGRARKHEVLAAVRSWWPATTVTDHDRADALVCATVGAFHLGDVMPFTVKERHHNGLQKVHWPDVVRA